MPTAKPVRHVHIHRHYHYHAAPPSKAPNAPLAGRGATYLADAFVPAGQGAQSPPAPPLPPSPPYYRSKPRPDTFWARQAWRAGCALERTWEILRPWAIWAANITLRAIDFVLTRITIGFLFRPIGGP